MLNSEHAEHGHRDTHVLCGEQLRGRLRDHPRGAGPKNFPPKGAVSETVFAKRLQISVSLALRAM